MPVLSGQSGEWTWVSGSSRGDASQSSIYGTQGVAAETNLPAGRSSAVGAIDSKGNLWLFGDGLWTFDTRTLQWAWLGGGNETFGVYGTLGVPSPLNHPGARSEAVAWTDQQGNLWLFGGRGNGANDSGDYLNDLWKFDTTTLQWTWVSGSSSAMAMAPGSYGTLGVSSSKNHPGWRSGATGWTDGLGNLWLFGGMGADASGEWSGYLNDLWRFNPSTLEWTWMGGSSNVASNSGGMPGVYGTRGVSASANVPGGRLAATGWTDAQGAMWIFGGLGCDSTCESEQFFNDLWRFEPSTLQWTWIAGSDKGDELGTYGTQGVPSSQNTPGARESALGWRDQNGRMWLFGGYGSDAVSWGWLNDLWEFDTGLKQWVWRGGLSALPKTGTFAPGSFGVQGVPDARNYPSGRSKAVVWLDPYNHVWIFGGEDASDGVSRVRFNDLWVLGAEQTAQPIFNPKSGTYQTPQSVAIADSSPGSAIYFTTDATKPTPNSVSYTSPIELTWSSGIAALAVSPGHLRSAVGIGKYTIDLSDLPLTPDPVISPGTQTLKASQIVTITDSNPSAIIYYSVGANLTANSPVYKGPITISASTKVSAVAYVPGHSFSRIVSASYAVATTTTTMQVDGRDPYTIRCGVTGPAIDGVSLLTGFVTLKDTTTNRILGTVNLNNSTAQIAYQSLADLPVNSNRLFAFGVGDLNGDKVLDVVVTNPGNATISTLIGNGDGTFQTQLVEATNSVVSDPDSLVVADLNGDGKLDIAVAGWSPSSGSQGVGSVSVLLGSGDGSFQPAMIIAQDASFESNGGLAMQRIIAADLNLDGKIDLAVANFGGNAVAVFLGRGDGTFQIPTSYAVGGAPGPLETGDFNNDGNRDLIVWNLQDSTLSLLMGNGDGTFKSQSVISNIPYATGASGSYLKSISVADLNRDGNLDLVADGILLGNGDGTFQPLPRSGTQRISSAVGDFNGDRIPDIAFTYWTPSTYNDNVGIMIGKGDGSFENKFYIGRGSKNRYQIVLADMNGDSKSDLTSAFSNGALSVQLRSDTQSAGAVFGNVIVDVEGLASHTLQCTYSGDGTYAASVADPVVESYGPAFPPTFSLLVGNYPASQTVAITAPVGEIHYTSDGSDPTIDSTVYTGPLTVTSSVKLKAIATAVGFLPSSISEAVYTIVATPMISVSGDSQSQLSQPQSLSEHSPRPNATAQTVSITDATPGAVIYYTTDGTVPSRSSTVYTSSITISKPSTVRAFATAAGFINSAIASASIDVTSPTFSMSATEISLGRGGTAGSTVTVSSTTGFAGMVSLTCVVTESPAAAVDPPTCAASRGVELGTSVQSGTAILTVHTTAPTLSDLFTPLRKWDQTMIFALLVLSGIAARRRRYRKMILALAGFAALSGLANCGGGSHSTTITPTKDPGTTPGAYMITVAGTGNDAAKTTATTSFKVTVN